MHGAILQVIAGRPRRFGLVAMSVVALAVLPLGLGGSIWAQTVASGDGQSFIGDAGGAGQREARLPPGLSSQNPATLADCRVAPYRNCVTDAQAWCKAAQRGHDAVSACIGERVQGCREQFGC